MLKRSLSFHRVLLGLVCVMPWGCRPGGPREEAPKDVFGFSSEPLPPGATEVSPERFDELLQQPGAFEINPARIEQEQVQSTAEEVSNDEVIAEFEQRLRQAGRSVVPVLPTFEEREAAGENVVDEVMLNSGLSSEVTLYGTRFMKGAAAHAIREFPKRENQEQFYVAMVGSMPAALQRQLGLPSVEEVRASPDPFPIEKLLDLNRTLAVNYELIKEEMKPPAFTAPSLPLSCVTHTGEGAGLDQTESADSCGFSDSGLFKHWQSPMREHVSCAKNQGQRGTCGSFAIVAAIEFQAHRKFQGHVNLSEQALYNREKSLWHPRQFEDGLWPFLTLQKMREDDWRVPFENQWNYNPSLLRELTFSKDKETVLGIKKSCEGYYETCSDTAGQGELSCTNSGLYWKCVSSAPNKNPGKQGYRVLKQSQIWDAQDRELSTNKMLVSLVFETPIIWGFAVPQNFYYPLNGFITYIAGQPVKGAHGVLIIGYMAKDEAQQLGLKTPNESKGWFIVKNSWNRCYGDAGFVYIPWNFVRDYTLEATVVHDIQ